MRAMLSRWRPEVLLFVLVLLATAPTVQLLMAHQASRLALTGAMWDDGTVYIDDYGRGLVEGLPPEERGGIVQVDYAVREGHLYSDKAPGQPLLAAPFYGLARVAGADPISGMECQFRADTSDCFNNLTLWWVSLWSAAIPAAVLAVMMRRLSLKVTGDPRGATVAAVGMSLSTLLLPFGTVLFSHVLAAALGFGAYLAAREENAPAARLAAAGLLGGLAVVTEYTTGIVVLVVGVLVLRRHGIGGAVAYAAGGLPAAAVLGIYNTIAWGSPTAFSYDFSGSFGDFHAQGLFGVRLPDPTLTAQVLFGERGLLTLTPVLLVGVWGLVLLTRQRRTRGAGIVGLVVFFAFVAVQGGWFSVTAGASPGPRYVVAGLPFVAVGVARAWRWSRAAVVLTIVLGAIGMFAAVFTNPLAQPTESFALGHWMLRVVNGRLGDTLLTPLIGAPWAQLAQLTVIAVTLQRLWAATTKGLTPEHAPVALPEEPASPLG